MEIELEALRYLKSQCQHNFVPTDFWDFWFSYYGSDPSIRKVYKSSLLKWNFYSSLFKNLANSKNSTLKID